MFGKKEVQQTSKKELDSLSTEGDLIFAPARCAPSLAPPLRRWNPFSEPVIFYDPISHYDVAFCLKDAPIQSIDQEEEKKSFE
jgi:hypothetical protein